MSTVLDRIDRAAKLLSGELADLRGDQMALLPVAMDRLATTISDPNLAGADGIAVASLMCNLINCDVDGSSSRSRLLRALAYFACLRELRAKVGTIDGRTFDVAQKSGAWSKVFDGAWNPVAHSFYFAWFAAAGVAYIFGRPLNIGRPIAGLLRISIKPA